MALLIGGTGGTFISAVVSGEVYDPVYDTPMDASFIYNLLPDFYRSLMQDQEVFSTVWSSAMQDTAAGLLNLWQIDYAKSLNTVPVLGQRKWIYYDLYREVDFRDSSTLESFGTPGLFTHAEDVGELTGSVVNRARHDRAVETLRGTVDHETSLAWQVDVSIQSCAALGSVLFGYFASGEPRLRNALVAGVLGAEASAGEPRPFLLHAGPGGVGAAAVGNVPLTLGAAYRLEATYTAATRVAVLSVVEILGLKLSGTSGQTTGYADAVVTNLFTDSAVNFDEEGVAVGDYLSAFGGSFEIVSVDGSDLTIKTIALPVDVSGASYQILGEVETSSISLDLGAESTVATFYADQFGAGSLDTGAVNALYVSSPAAARRKTLDFTSTQWRFLDPSVGHRILSLPRLQDTVSAPQELLHEGTDYSVRVAQVMRLRNLSDVSGTVQRGDLVRGAHSLSRAVVTYVGVLEVTVAPLAGNTFRLGEELVFNSGASAILGSVELEDLESSTIRFQEPPLVPYWAEYTAFDEHYIQDNFGANVGLYATSSDQYKARVRGLYYAYFSGPTIAAIRSGVHILLGLPIAESDGVVESINPSYSGTLGLLTVGGVDYLYPLAVGTTLHVDDAVTQFMPLSEGVEVVDYLSHPTWWVHKIGFHEIQKYHSFQINVNLDVFSSETLELAAAFVDRIRPTWKYAYFSVYKNLVDEVEMSDQVKFALRLNFYDTICDPPPVIAYDEAIYEGAVPDWSYDQGAASWDATTPSMRQAGTLLAGTVLLTNGSAAAEGTGTAFLATLGGPGAVSDRRLAVATHHSGSADVTAASHVLEDPGADFLESGREVVIGDVVTVAGVGDFSVFAVTSTVLTLGRSFPVTTTVSYTIAGRFLSWAEVASVTDDDTLDFSDAFPGTTGDYTLYLINNLYFKAYYDRFDELCPDERLSFVATVAAGYVGGFPLAVELPDSRTTTVTQNITAPLGSPGDSVTTTLAELTP